MLGQQEWTRVHSHRCRLKRASRLIQKKTRIREMTECKRKDTNKNESILKLGLVLNALTLS